MSHQGKGIFKFFSSFHYFDVETNVCDCCLHQDSTAKFCRMQGTLQWTLNICFFSPTWVFPPIFWGNIKSHKMCNNRINMCVEMKSYISFTYYEQPNTNNGAKSPPFLIRSSGRPILTLTIFLTPLNITNTYTPIKIVMITFINEK